MKEYHENLMDELDASVFSGDAFHDKKSNERFKYYLKRWIAQSEVNDRLIIDNCDCEPPKSCNKCKQ